MAERDDLVYVRHILDAVDKVQRYTGHLTYAGFVADERTRML